MRAFFIACCVMLITSCGFHLQEDLHLAQPLQRLYLQTNDPYGDLTRDLTSYLKLSHVQLVSTPEEAQTILVITQDATSQSLLSVSGTQQTRQYKLTTTAAIEVTDTKGRTLIEPQSFSESKVITVQSNQILGSSNEANVYYQQMRRALAYAIINRMASKVVTEQINQRFPITKHRKKP